MTMRPLLVGDLVEDNETGEFGVNLCVCKTETRGVWILATINEDGSVRSELSRGRRDGMDDDRRALKYAIQSLSYWRSQASTEPRQMTMVYLGPEEYQEHVARRI